MNVNRGYCETHFSWSGCSEKDSDWLEIKGKQKVEQDTGQCQNYPLSNKKRIGKLLGWDASEIWRPHNNFCESLLMF
jgi:hypothetical protein